MPAFDGLMEVKVLIIICVLYMDYGVKIRRFLHVHKLLYAT